MNPEISYDERKFIVVFIVGGITFAEIAAIKFLAKFYCIMNFFYYYYLFRKGNSFMHDIIN